MTGGTLRRPATLIVVAVSLSASAPADAQREPSGTILGAIRDSAGHAVAGAEVRIGGSGLGAYTDESGAFRLTSVPVGTIEVEVRRLGFHPLRQTVQLSRGATLRLEVTVTPLPYAIAPLVVRGSTQQSLGPLAEFYRRREQGGGRFIARDEIDRRGAAMTTDLFRSVPGVTVVRTRTMSRVLRFRGANCAPLVWLDGIPLAQASEFDFDALPPRSIEGIEIYSLANLPPQFRSSGARSDCGVIVVWSRRGEPRPSRGAAQRAEQLAEQRRAGTVYTAEEVDRPARAATGRAAEPVYPASLLARGVAGSATVEFVVDTLGRLDPTTFSIISSADPLFSEAVRRALENTRFHPAMLAQRPVRQVVQLVFQFILPNATSEAPDSDGSGAG